MSGRDPYAEVGKALRSTLQDAASADPPLRLWEWRVFAAVIAQTASWSKFEDSLPHAEILKFLEREPNRDNRREVSKAINTLAERGFIGYVPGYTEPTGAKYPSEVSLPHNGKRGGDSTRGYGGAKSPRTGGESAHEQGGGITPSNEKFREEPRNPWDSIPEKPPGDHVVTISKLLGKSA